MFFLNCFGQKAPRWSVVVYLIISLPRGKEVLFAQSRPQSQPSLFFHKRLFCYLVELLTSSSHSTYTGFVWMNLLRISLGILLSHHNVLTYGGGNIDYQNKHLLQRINFWPNWLFLLMPTGRDGLPGLPGPPGKPLLAFYWSQANKNSRLQPPIFVTFLAQRRKSGDLMKIVSHNRMLGTQWRQPSLKFDTTFGRYSVELLSS